MKKFLLFLSCFLITWCSVQAANPQITSATYNESTSQFYVNCTSGNNLYIDVICMKTGPVLSKVNINTYKTIDLPITSRPGEYDLVLYANGTPCHDKKVTVTQYGHINNITNISTSSVTVNYSMFHAEYPNNCYLKIGNYKHNITNVKNGSYTWKNLKLTEGQTYTCEIYVDGNRKHTYQFTVPKKYGHINNVYNISTSSVTVNYTMRYAETSNCYLKIGNNKYNIKNGENKIYKWPLNLTEGQTYTCEIYVDGNRKHTYQFTVPKKYGHINNVYNISTSSVTVNYTMRYAETSSCYLKIGNYKHNITNVENGSYTWSGLNLTEGQTYTCEIYVDGVRKDTYNFKVIGPTFANSIRKLTPMGNRLKIDFTLRDTGVDVRFRVTVGSLTGYKGETFYYDYGPCDQHEGTCEVSVPYYTGQVIYAAELFVNGSNVNGNSTQAYNR